jgi:DNA processing protein
MTLPPLSSNTQAILLLTAPLILGKTGSVTDLLSHTEYRKLARRLREMELQPADLLDSNFGVSNVSLGIVEESRLRRLLERGFLLSQVVDHWHALSIWVMSRADSCYPRRLKARLREDAPALLYGCGQIELLDRGGLAIVGSRHVNDELIESTMAMGRLTGLAGKTVVSGGAKGIDQAAMHGALEAGGNAIGVLADSLEKTALKREYRSVLRDGRLVLISPFDPSAGFNVGHAMQRNKVIYTLADASLVMNSDFNRGGTWAGAVEQLEHRVIPVYIRSTGNKSEGLAALSQKGALPWPNPTSIGALKSIFDASLSVKGSENQAGLPFVKSRNNALLMGNLQSNVQGAEGIDHLPIEDPGSPAYANGDRYTDGALDNQNGSVNGLVPTGDDLSGSELQASEVLFATVRQLIQRLLKEPKKDTEVASILRVSASQARVWLARLIEEEVVVKQKRPVSYVAKQSPLFKEHD